MRKDYIIYGLTEEQLKATCKQALNGELDKKKNIRIMFNMFGRISHLEGSFTDAEAKEIRKSMKKENRLDKTNHYELILKGAV